jgi:DNA-directed RNA polymerase beta' subunit
VSCDHIAIRIEEEALSNKGFTLACVASPDNIGQIEVYINFADITPYVQAKFELPSGTDVRSLITSENTDYFTAREVAMTIIKNTHVQGVTGIKKTRVRQNNITGEWNVDTVGSNFLSILNTPGVDPKRTMSDNMWEVYNVLGIEAARRFLVKESTAVLSFDGTYINARHIRLLISSMCFSGIITGANRDGISRKAGPVAKGMFEKPVDNFAEASIFGEKDNLRGVAASVMFGTLANLGTGSVKIRDLEKMPATTKPPTKTPPTRKPIVVPIKSVGAGSKTGKKK